MTAPVAPFVTLIIPLLDDWAELEITLRGLRRDPRVEVIVVDGGGSPRPAREPHVRCLRSAPGRGRQMNAGAAEARGAWLLFLHADTRLPPGWLDELESAARDPAIVGGSFTLRIDSTARWARLIERGVAARVRWLGLPYGDQAFFVRADVFGALGGYRPMPLMEDVDFVRRLNRMGRVRRSPLPVLTSARRWERDGWVRRTVGNAALIILYFLGVPTERLARFYAPRRSFRGERIALAVVARAPSDEGGKTRLLAALGGTGGPELRRALLLDTLGLMAAVRDVDRAVLFTPRTAEAEVGGLAGPGVDALPQRGATLGERLRNAFEDLFARQYDAVIVIGSDTPSLPPELIERAASALRGGGDSVVLGPAVDGGYYLIGLRQSHPELFEGVAWSTSEVLGTTLAIARRAGLSVTLLPEWFDVDTVDDLLRVSGGHTRATEAWVAARATQFER